MPSLDLAQILAPHTVAEFLVDYLGAQPLHIPGSADRFCSLLEAVASSENTEDDRLDLLDPSIAQLAQSLERAFEAPVTISLQQSEIPLRRAATDILILQLTGEATWPIFPNAATEPAFPPLRDVALRDGHALYIPQGFWYSSSSGSRNLRLIAQIRHPTGRDLLDWLVSSIRDDEWLQAPIPRFAALTARADYQTQFRKTLAAACRAPGLFFRFDRHNNEQAATRPTIGNPWDPALPGDSLIHLAATRDLHIKSLDPGIVAITVGGKPLAFPLEAAPLLHFLRDREPVSIDGFFAEFAAHLDPDELADFLKVLSREGVICFRPIGAS